MGIITRKICLLGDFAVGKTSLVRRFVDRQFSDEYLSTIGVKISRKKVTCTGNGDQSVQELQLIIWDIEGETKFRGIAPNYLQGGKGAIFVADVSRPHTIDNLINQQKLWFSVNPKAPIAIALNKMDLMETEHRDQLLARVPISDEQVALLTPTSAKTGDNVDQMFQTLGSAIAP
jgi:small GTP-binding protein